MSGFAQISYKILFLGLLATLISMSVPAGAEDPGNVGGPGSGTIFEGRGALAPLPAPETPPTSEPALDTTPADEVRTLPGGADDETAQDPAEIQESAENQVSPAENPDKPQDRKWWKFW